jgi:hypothetical protein
MMKAVIAFLLAAMVVGIANARDRALPRFAKFDVSTIANFGPGCRIKILIPERSDFKAYYSSENNLGSGGLIVSGMPYQEDRSLVGFNCYRADYGPVNNGWAIFKPNEGWHPNIDQSTAQLISLKAFRYYDLISRNSTGWAVSVDDTFGDERFRSRKFSYCLIYKSKAVCDQDIKTGYLPDIKRNKRADLTPYILDLLRTVEFLEDAPPLDSGNRRP